MTPPIEANSRHLWLARRALRAAVTHLRNAANRCCMSDATRDAVTAEAVALEEVNVVAVGRFETETNEHLSNQLASRRRRAA